MLSLLLLCCVVVTSAKCPYGFDQALPSDLETLTAKGVRAFHCAEAWGEWVDAHTTEYTTWSERSPANRLEGSAAWKQFQAQWIGATSDYNADVTWCMQSGNVVECNWRATGRFTGALGNVQPTGKKFDVTGVWVVVWAAGKISFLQNFWDQMVFYSQVGVLTDPATSVATAGSVTPLSYNCIKSHFNKLWGTNDPEDIDVSDYTESSVCTLSWAPGTAWKGLDAIRSIYKAYKKNLYGIHPEIKNFVAGVNSAAVEVEFSIDKVIGDFGEMKASGKPTRYTCTAFWGLIGEKIATENWSCDWLPFARDGDALLKDPLKQA
eukprot:NODE_223_length_1141_cov_442.484221_g218_i0.p1 GENE.NODE_223_length_1141_cov_442.484221_g218_i0~~NODE_223_length_1141_cov_442.484221_g218_i0.p1  ORF type:complete len:321 (+),score=47.82 NODE_223_length_1141_cov_442.484221_g218_i0:55-1017(+)